MTDSASSPEKSNLPAVLSERTQEIRLLKERYENIVKIADPADRLLTLREFGMEVRAFKSAEADYVAGLFPNAHAWTAIAMPGMLAGGAALIAGGGIFAIPAMILGVVFGGVGAHIADKIAVRKYEETYSDLADAYDLINRIARAREDIVRTADIKAIARSPRGVEAFTEFPKLKEKFLLVAAVDKILEEDRLLASGELGKQAPDTGASTIKL